MSSLAAAQADGYYVPPEYYESGAYKKKSRNQFARESSSSSSKKNDYRRSSGRHHDDKNNSNVFRFELPESGICRGCDAFVGKGTRFNASKADSGSKYFTTTIWEFRMKCRQPDCQQIFVLRTDPANRNFCYLEGLDKLVHSKGSSSVSSGPPVSAAEHEGSNIDGPGSASASGVRSGVDRLQDLKAQRGKSLCELEVLERLRSQSDRLYIDDAAGNAALRRTFRKERKLRKRQLEDAADLGWRGNMPLLDSTTQDLVEAAGTTFGQGGSKSAAARVRLNRVRQSSIFGCCGAGAEKKHNNSSKSFCPRRTVTLPDSVSSSPPSVVRETRRGKRRRQMETVDLTTTTTAIGGTDASHTDDDKTEGAPLNDPPASGRRKVVLRVEQQARRIGGSSGTSSSSAGLKATEKTATTPSSSALEALTCCYDSASSSE